MKFMCYAAGCAVEVSPSSTFCDAHKQEEAPDPRQPAPMLENRTAELAMKSAECERRLFPPLPAPIERALATQVGGSHYKNLAIQPAEFCHRNRIGKLEGDVIYYVARWRDKNGVEDLRKARHTLDILIELETAKPVTDLA